MSLPESSKAPRGEFSSYFREEEMEAQENMGLDTVAQLQKVPQSWGPAVSSQPRAF